jgi:hypothetical protein
MTLAGAIGLARSGATGKGPLAKIGLVLAGLGTAAAVVAEPMFLGPSGVAEPLIQIGTLTAALGLVTAGIGVWRARRLARRSPIRAPDTRTLLLGGLHAVADRGR